MTAEPPGLATSRRRFLRYWSLNIMLARSIGWVWMPGFSYSPDELRRFETLRAAIPGRSVAIWLFATTLTYFVVAVAFTGVLLMALTVLWPNAADVPEAGFFALLILMIVLTIGLGMPLSIVWGGAAADWLGSGTLADEGPGDAALYAKIARQFRRMAVFLGVAVAVAAVIQKLLG